MNHVVTLHRLKKDHVPTYLTGRGVTTGDITDPINDMTIIDWVEFARDHLNEEEQTIEQGFPHTNTVDWIQIDGPGPTLQAWANGADADITTLETEMDAAETSITALDTRVQTLESSGGTTVAATATIHVDAGFTGTSDGSLLKPYTSLKTATGLFVELKYLCHGATT